MRIAGCLVGSRFEIPVAQTSAASAQELDFLSVVGHLTEEFAGVGIVNSRSARNFDNAVLAVLSEAAAFAAGLSVGSEDVALIFQVEQCPKVAVTPEDDVSSASSVSAVGASFRHIFGAVEVA